MKAAFLVAVLCVALLYTYTAFTELAFLTMSGRLGPAFFPRIIGVLLIVACLYNLALLVRRPGPDGSDVEGGDWRIVVGIIALATAFVALLEILGGLPAMVLFLFAALSLLNRGRLVQNLLISLLLPAGIYLLFDVWLKASTPQGIIPLPV
jgi:putative tricarboxylic transport membrane protein